MYTRSETVVLTLTSPLFSISVSGFLVKNVFKKSFMTDFFLITLQINVIHFALKPTMQSNVNCETADS